MVEKGAFVSQCPYQARNRNVMCIAGKTCKAFVPRCQTCGRETSQIHHFIFLHITITILISNPFLLWWALRNKNSLLMTQALMRLTLITYANTSMFHLLDCISTVEEHQHSTVVNGHHAGILALDERRAAHSLLHLSVQSVDCGHGVHTHTCLQQILVLKAPLPYMLSMFLKEQV